MRLLRFFENVGAVKCFLSPISKNRPGDSYRTSYYQSDCAGEARRISLGDSDPVRCQKFSEYIGAETRTDQCPDTKPDQSGTARADTTTFDRGSL